MRPLNKLINYTTATLIFFSLSGCMPSNIKLAPGADQVVISDNAPGEGYTKVGPISASHGVECSKVHSETGSADSVINTLKNKAVESNIDYIKIDELTEPSFKRNCFTRRFTVSGVAYRSKQATAHPIQPTPAPTQETGTEAVTMSTPDRPYAQGEVEQGRAINTEQLNRELRTLYKLKTDGIISEKEFNELKVKLLKDYR